MNFLYSYDTDYRLSEFGNHCVPVSMCPISDKPCGEIWMERKWREFYQPDIDAALVAIKEHPAFVFAKVPIVSNRREKGYFNEVVRNQTHMLNDTHDTCEKVRELLNITNMWGSEGEWHIVHSMNVYTNTFTQRAFYLTLDVENIMPGGVSLTGIFRKYQIDELLKTL